MSILVQKYGGSSLSDLERLSAVADKVVATREAGHDVVVVVSAMGDSTDELLEMARELAGSPSRRELDMLLSVGERISMALLSIAIQERGYEAVSLTGSQCGIITTHNHSNARIMDVRPFRVQDELELGRIVIVAGYQGTSYRREVTTLGRGGSDTTAVALAAALGADACEIYSDVEGVFSADPRAVLSAKQLLELSHEEMLEMARSGARVLNEQAVEFARRAKIALYARKTHSPSTRGTVVRPDGFHERVERAEMGQPAVAVSHIERGVHIQAGESADEVIALLGERDCVVCEWTPEQRCELFLDTENVHDLEDISAKLRALGDDVTVERAGLVSVVGQGIGGQTRWVRQGHKVVKEAGIKPLSLAISLSRLSWIIQTADVKRALGALHDLFISMDVKPAHHAPSLEADS
ncbi:aspartate kinase [Persicimonas caeni]|uniref:Aspartokinase n=1 Tax=Persicimonas caeni TaxID=2292766 RepID=A0A4Y6PQ72_PERCE|nr:aspartate kinase [Persicimonas caeni]QDG49915.1 aspartate kinase [Persicimonas caeni]QED31136.1 aspartate kinase [Persicimonas caeni]